MERAALAGQDRMKTSQSIGILSFPQTAMYQALVINNRRIAKGLCMVQTAFRSLEQAGVHSDAGTIFFRAESDVIEEEAAGLPYVFYTGQDEVACHGSGGPLYLKFAIENYEDQGAKLLDAVKIIIQHIEAQGLKVIWENSIETCIEVSFDSVSLDKVEADNATETLLTAIFIHKDLLGKYAVLFADDRFYQNPCDDRDDDKYKSLIEFYLHLLYRESVVDAIARLAPELERSDISYFQRVFDNDLEMHPLDYMIEWDEEELQEILEADDDDD